MSRSQLQESEAVTVPDKAMLATVLNYLKNKNLKETEEVLRKELSTQGGGDTARSLTLGTMQFSSMGQSGTEPMKYEESYTSQAPFTSTPTTETAAYLKLANGNADTSTSLNKASEHPIFTVSLKASNSPVRHSPNQEVTEKTSIEEMVVGETPRNHDNSEDMMSPPSATTTAATSPEEMPLYQTFPKLLMPASKTTDKTPLWFQKNSSSSAGEGCQSIFLPSSLSTAASLGLGGGSGLILKSPPTGVVSSVGGQNLAARSIVGGQSLASIQPSPPALMYHLMTSPPSCVTRPTFLGPHTVLTVLPNNPATGNLVTPTTTNLVNPQSIFLASSMANQNLGGSPQQVTQKEPEDKSAKSAHMIIAEPATGQAEYPSSAVSSTTAMLPPHPRTLASIPSAELTPQHLELKAFAEDFKTRRIRLGFTQGAVGTSLAEKGYNNFAQSTISRFEQMQLSPANAATIRVILEKWLREAESPETVPSNQSNDLPMMAGRKRKKRAVFTPQTKSTLDEFFARNPRPNRQAIESISQKLDLLPEEVRVWFCNKRQKSKSGSVSTLYDHESSSTTSSGVPSPTFSEGGMSQKRRSPSPPKTPFTIEELSKSSSNGSSGLISSPVQLSTSSLLPLGGLVASVTQSMNRPLIFATSGSPPIIFGGGNKSPPLVLPSQFLTSNPIIADQGLN